ncbi:MAG: hypothetical protein KJ057_10100 [Phycisphaerae bacterium]|nr:MAG: hypothetical protein F9K17_03070 [Phycisphaerae bacterium]MBE7458381.1 hypothetical protein [Planctomycetia bacterium]MCQ3920886.1 hypothetical protein [Planctomycetota bacterium]MCK6465195.1 hypothetical protein [Phycisphaerae bacterium]MCL4718810.1 hypothetical protein [Phycisphaerae bacterium]
MSARLNFLHEYQHTILWTMLAGLVEGRFGSLVVSKSFSGSAAMVAIATATPTASYLFSVYWGMLLARAPKLAVQALFVAGTALFAAAASLASPTRGGAGAFIFCLGLSQVFLAGVLTLRPAIWQVNYPATSRGRITARLHAANLFVSTSAALIVAPICDRDPRAFGIVLQVCAAAGLLSLVFLLRMRVRGEGRRRRQREQALRSGDKRLTTREKLSEWSPGRVWRRMHEAIAADPAYARYLSAQTFLGLSNLLVMAVLTVLVTREIDGWGGDVYWVGTVLFTAMPRLLTFGSLRQWGGLFDRVGVLRFRVINCWFWGVAAVLGLAGELAMTYRDAVGPISPVMMMSCFALQAVAYGFGMGGGKVAWSLGHLHFASGARGDLYMGIHVTLTGVRGTVATLLGVYLWQWIGWGIWIVALVFMMIAHRMFKRLADEEGSRTVQGESAGRPGV